jgi:hypothetical protein
MEYCDHEVYYSVRHLSIFGIAGISTPALKGGTMDDSSYRLNFDQGKKNKTHHHSKIRKSMLKLVKLQNLAAKCCMNPHDEL